MDFLRFAGGIWNKADQALGGWLPGGGTASPATKAVQWAAKPDPVGRIQQEVKSRIQRAVDPRYARDAVLNLPIVPEPERRFVQAMTGGIPGDTITELPPEFLSYIKDATLKKENINKNIKDAKKVIDNLPDHNDKVAQLFADFVLPKLNSTSNVSLYNYGRDIANSLGNVGVWKDAEGNVVIKDRWKVDNNTIATPIDRNAMPDRKEFYSDLQEGGALASWLFNRARDAGTYRPIDYEIRVPAKEWEAIVPTEGPEESDNSITKNRDYLYRYLSHLIAPNRAPKPKRDYSDPYSENVQMIPSKID